MVAATPQQRDFITTTEGHYHLQRRRLMMRKYKAEIEALHGNDARSAPLVLFMVGIQVRCI